MSSGMNAALKGMKLLQQRVPKNKKFIEPIKPSRYVGVSGLDVRLCVCLFGRWYGGGLVLGDAAQIKSNRMGMEQVHFHTPSLSRTPRPHTPNTPPTTDTPTHQPPNHNHLAPNTTTQVDDPAGGQGGGDQRAGGGEAGHGAQGHPGAESRGGGGGQRGKRVFGVFWALLSMSMPVFVLG